MEFILHRINTVAELENAPENFGVELDLRDRGDRLILHHEPFSDGEDFEDYLGHYRHGTLIVNVKNEGIEMRALEHLKKRGIENFFFLDSSFPMIVRLSGEGENRFSVRYSEYESLETAMAMQGRARWVWVDCFTRFPLDGAGCAVLKKKGFQICLVSPEIQSREQDIEEMAAHILREGIAADAICAKSKNIDIWRRALGC
ncbi:MAG: hypothetical protein WCX65_14070 [bacterium]